LALASLARNNTGMESIKLILPFKEAILGIETLIESVDAAFNQYRNSRLRFADQLNGALGPIQLFHH